MSAEVSRRPINGWAMLPLLLVGLLAAAATTVWTVYRAAVLLRDASGWVTAPPILGATLATLVLLVLLCGFFTLQPNQSAVLLLFGHYYGTARREGFNWANPFFRKIKISLRTRNFNSETVKVNDQRGNPIDIAAVVVWRVENTAQACFDVDDYQDYVHIQSEAAIRHLASEYPYDSGDANEQSLRGNLDQVSKTLQGELQLRLSKAGVVVEEARLSHLAYAPEIAGAMLRRQQAEAVVAARTRIVEGAVGMVELALARLDQHKTVQLDDERKAAMVTNLLVVLCGEQAAQPVVNSGTLYT
ncbi:MAG: hypothetical protein CHACPFDD_02885 [Phycisphaerae bacterium]|nr:hypothetical protein [Phycisphaerae bacterium]